VGNILLQPQARHVWRTQAGGRCLVS
jgi:hypothetical protein